MSQTQVKINGKTIPLYFGMECAEFQLKAQLEGKSGNYSTNFQLILFGHKNWCTINDSPMLTDAQEVNTFLEELYMNDGDTSELEKINAVWIDSISHKSIKKKVVEIQKATEKLISENSNGLPSAKSDLTEKSIIDSPLPTSS